ncbi:MAG TPA: TonB-dependent receptor [Alteraurantiacibacter sp.]
MKAIHTISARAIRNRMLAAGASAIALAIGSQASAQDTAAEETENEDRAIIVTGSRLIIPDGMQAPNPVTVVAAEDLEAIAPGALISSVSQLPQFVGNETPQSSNFFVRSGTGTLNLRGLGVNRTLTLLNGRRMPTSSAFGGVDINLFPEAMITGIETQTGGASAAYGSDAVAGVVNFLIDTNYTGLTLNVQGGITDRGDGESIEGSAAWGTNLGDRGHFQISGEYYESEGIHNYEGRDWYQGWGPITGADGMIRFYPNVVSANASFDGVIFAPGTAINGLAFDQSGNTAPFVLGSPTQGAIGTPPARHSISGGGSGDDLGSEVFTLFPDVDRYSIFSYADYELSDSVTVYGQYMHSYTHQFQYNTPRGSFGGTPTALTIFQDNAFLPDDLRQTMIDNGIPSFTLRRMGSIEDIGNVYFDDRTRQNIGVAGLTWDIDSGGFMDGWKMDAYYQYGHSKREWRQHGLRVDRIFAAADAVDDGTGNIVCRVSMFPGGNDAFPGCEPINLFGRGNASPGAVDYVVGNDVGEQITTDLFFADTGFALGIQDSYTARAEKVNLTTFKQHLAELSFAGTLMEGWAGPISLAFGGNYRKESIYQIVRDSTNRSSDHETGRPVMCNDPAIGLRGVNGADCANTVGIQYSKVSNIQGEGDVWEAFAETLVPLVDADGFSANLHGAVRWADYSGSGSVWAYKGGLEVGIADTLRLRGTYSRDVRAANLSERFDKTGGAATVTDPLVSATDVAACEAATPGDPSCRNTYNVTIFSGGNPLVSPEEADTFTVGAVFAPEFLPGFSASVDWYRVKINGAIATVGTQNVYNGCVVDNVPEFCDLVTFDPTQTPTLNGDPVPILVGNIFINVDQQVVSGVDAEVSYRTDLDLFGGDESLGVRLFAAWLTERYNETSNGAITDFAGQTGALQSSGGYLSFPDFRVLANLNYRNGGFSAFLNARYIGEGVQDLTLEEGVTIEDNTVDDVIYVDLRLGYEFRMAGADLEIFGNVTNLFDRDPPLTPAYSAFLGYASQANPGVYDTVGRRYTVGIKLKM